VYSPFLPVLIMCLFTAILFLLPLLHSKSIQRGDVKIFDLGMARELRQEDFVEEDGLYRNMSGMTGTLRYMAPEVWLGNTYNASCDVYSFAVLFWEMMALEGLPFGHIKGQEAFVQSIVEGGLRPPISKQNSTQWPKAVPSIIEKSWSSKWQDRYTMEKISDLLRHELVALRGGDDSGLEHKRRRSTFVFQRESLSSILDDLELSEDDDDAGEEQSPKTPAPSVPTTMNSSSRTPTTTNFRDFMMRSNSRSQGLAIFGAKGKSARSLLTMDGTAQMRTPSRAVSLPTNASTTTTTTTTTNTEEQLARSVSLASGGGIRGTRLSALTRKSLRNSGYSPRNSNSLRSSSGSQRYNGGGGVGFMIGPRDSDTARLSYCGSTNEASGSLDEISEQSDDHSSGSSSDEVEPTEVNNDDDNDAEGEIIQDKHSEDTFGHDSSGKEDETTCAISEGEKSRNDLIQQSNDNSKREDEPTGDIGDKVKSRNEVFEAGFGNSSSSMEDEPIVEGEKVQVGKLNQQ
jgi:hypothetical protein